MKLPQNLPLNLLTNRWSAMLEPLSENEVAQAYFDAFIYTLKLRHEL